MSDRRWWQHPATVVASLVLCFPIGILLTWLSRWTTRTKTVVTVIVVVLAGLAAAVDEPDDRGELAAAADVTTTWRSELDPERTIPTSTTTSTPPTTAPPTTTPPTTPPPNSAPPIPAGVQVLDVIDGDTIDVAGGDRIRLIGIDTPERGVNGFTAATSALTALIAGRPVVLVAGAQDDRDRYGRLLRYVEVGGVDIGLELIRQGHAIARYDSRDGYGRHPREDSYIAAGAASPPQAQPLVPPTTAAPPPPAPAGGATDPMFGTCKQAIGAGYGPYVRGVDPEYDWYRDADNDGVVCE